MITKFIHQSRRVKKIAQIKRLLLLIARSVGFGGFFILQIFLGFNANAIESKKDSGACLKAMSNGGGEVSTEYFDLMLGAYIKGFEAFEANSYIVQYLRAHANQLSLTQFYFSIRYLQPTPSSNLIQSSLQRTPSMTLKYGLEEIWRLVNARPDFKERATELLKVKELIEVKARFHQITVDIH